jgi:hypothetical protein
MTDLGNPAQSTPSKPDPTAAADISSEERLLLRRIELSAGPIGRMIYTISLIAGIISIIVVLSVVVIAVAAPVFGLEAKVPEVLVNWGGIILGFYFGQFISLVKDYMGVIQAVSKKDG